MEEIIKTLYYNPKVGFSSLNKFYQKCKEADNRITLKQVREFLQKQKTYQVNKQDKKPKYYTSIYAPYPLYNCQVDILVYDKYEVDKYKYILCLVDTYSRYAVCKALTNRYNTTIVKTLTDMFKDIGVPERINCDNEFNTSQINSLWKKDNIQVYFSDPNEPFKNAIVERFNRTLRTLLQKFRTANNGKLKWYKYLDDLVYNYNHTLHSTIKETPYDVFTKNKKSRQIINVIESRPFEIGDKVRIKWSKEVFDKGSEIGYSDEVYVIHKKYGDRYILMDDKGVVLKRRYKPYELKRVSDIQTFDYLSHIVSRETHGDVYEGEKELTKQQSRNLSKIRALNELKTHTTATHPEIIGEKRTRKKKQLEDYETD